MEPTASEPSSTMGCRMVSSSSSVMPTASWRRRSASPAYSTGSVASARTMWSISVMRFTQAPKSWRAESRSFSASSA